MNATQINMFDVAVAFTLVSSGIFAFRRGLLMEVMSLGTWVLASVFAFAFFPTAQPFFHAHIKNEVLADAATATALFSLAIIILVPLSQYLNNLIKTPTLSSIDRSLGFVFGVLRGFLVACLFYFGLTFFFGEEPQNQPSWMSGARTTSALAYGVEGLRAMIPESLEAVTNSRALEASREAAQEAAQDARHLEDISTPVPTYSTGHGQTPSSYGDDSREKMDALIDRK